jgi:hypothetical protein
MKISGAKLYDPEGGDYEKMFARPRHVIKDGEAVALNEL